MYLLFLQTTTPNNIRNIKKGQVTAPAPHTPPITGGRLCLSSQIIGRGVTLIFVILDITLLVHVNI